VPISLTTRRRGAVSSQLQRKQAEAAKTALLEERNRMVAQQQEALRLQRAVVAQRQQEAAATQALLEKARQDASQRARAAEVAERKRVAATLKVVAEAQKVEDLFQSGVVAIKELVGAQRATLFMLDRPNNELWSRVGDFANVIRVKVGQGIAGQVAATQVGVNVADAYDHPHFDKSFDRQSGFRTRSVLCVPTRARDGRLVGVLQVINKDPAAFKAAGGEGTPVFSPDDDTLLRDVAGYVCWCVCVSVCLSVSLSVCALCACAAVSCVYFGRCGYVMECGVHGALWVLRDRYIGTALDNAEQREGLNAALLSERSRAAADRVHAEAVQKNLEAVSAAAQAAQQERDRAKADAAKAVTVATAQAEAARLKAQEAERRAEQVCAPRRTVIHAGIPVSSCILLHLPVSSSHV